MSDDEKDTPPIVVSEWGFRISIPHDGDMLPGQEIFDKLVRETSHQLADRLIEDAFNPKPREPYVPPPERWYNNRDIHCPSCGKAGFVWIKEDGDPEMCGDHHQCRACDAEFDLWIVPR